MTTRFIQADRGTKLSCRGWVQEAALRMLMNNLNPDVAEDAAHLIVYGGAVKRRAIGNVLTRSCANFANLRTTKRCSFNQGRRWVF